ncbi:MAG: hypothetical protein WDZ35_01495 [Crocinitomicaceae bacterium]
MTTVLFKKREWSFYTLLGLLGILLILSLNYGAPNPLSWDTIGYHAYFVEWITDGDLAIQNLSHYEQIVAEYDNTNTLYQFVQLEEGFITKYSIGWSLLNAPFLYIGHLAAGVFNYPQDGFSLPYQIACHSASLFYTFLGLFFCRKLFRLFFSDQLTAVLLLILVLGTNYLHMNYACIGLVHVYLFTLYALLLYHTHLFYQNQHIKRALFIGVILGLMVLIRPTEIVAGIIPLLYGLTSAKQIKSRLKDLFFTKYYYTAVLTFTICCSLQLFYWKYTTGYWVYYSYQNPGEGLDLHQPHLLEVLFSFRRGWFIYTPIMLLIIPALVTTYRHYKKWFSSLLIFTFVNLYLISSWTTWWYAGSFSSRALEHSYPIYILLIGFLLSRWSGVRKKIALFIIGIFVCLNLFQTWQVQHGVLHLFRMSKPYYFSILGQTSPPSPEQEKLLFIDRNLTQFENKEDYQLIKKIPYREKSDTITQISPYSKALQFSYRDMTDKDHLWVVGKAHLSFLESDSLKQDQNIAIHLCANAFHNGRVYAWRNVTLTENNQQQSELQIDYLTPHVRSTSDTISVGLWLQEGPSVVVENLYLEVYQHK